MKNHLEFFRLIRLISFIQVSLWLGIFPSEVATAQIIPDRTLPLNSTVNPDGNTLVINGGTTAGENLFHSFEHFSISASQIAQFNNALTIQNIFSRVTGQAVSHIDGLIRANGRANLFFLNPNGIIFGPQASLELGGSFLASTADRLLFADGSEYSAVNPENSSVLTVSVPIGLGLGNHPGEILVQGLGHNFKATNFSPVTRNFNSVGLGVKPGKTLALLGGSLTLNGGILTAPEGRIELGSVESGTVKFEPTSWTLVYEGVDSFRNIRLTERAVADASGLGGGFIQVQGRKIELDNGAVIFNQNLGLVPSGTIRLNASDSMHVSGTDPISSIPGGIRTEVLSQGSGSDILVTTPKLKLVQGGTIQTVSYSEANAGKISLNISDSLQVLGSSPRSPRLVSNISSITFLPGRAGNISVRTGQYKAKDGGTLLSATAGTGNSGDIHLEVSDAVELIGFEPNLFTPSSISSSTAGSGKAGNVTLNTSRLRLENGGRIDSSTVASGSAGSLLLNASESIEIKGVIPNSRSSSSIVSSANLVEVVFRESFELPPEASLTGKSGDVTINTGQLLVLDGAGVSVTNEGSGDAGVLQINAPLIWLEGAGSLSAATLSGEGGNITISSKDIRLGGGSEISAAAGGLGNGGNIFIDTDTLVVLEGSQISANAFQGTGGNIQISALGVFVSPERSITASSELGIDGTVEINTPETNLQKELEQLSANLIPTEEMIAKSCFTRRNQHRGTFVNTGTGGLPITPETAINEFPVLDEAQTSPRVNAKPLMEDGTPESPQPERVWISSVAPWKPGEPMIQGQKIIRTTDGRTLLVAAASPEDVQSAQYLICR